MVFTELRFVLFFVAVFAAYWALRGDQARKWLLLLASWGFYAAWDWRYLGLLLASTAVDYAAARGLDAMQAGPFDAPRRRLWLWLSVGTNLGILCAFKYYDFFVDSAAALLGVEAARLGLVLPLGISFFTFQTMSYTIDVYHRRLRAGGALDVALYVAFFPQLVAGPIVRAQAFLPQLASGRRFAAVPVRAALRLPWRHLPSRPVSMVRDPAPLRRAPPLSQRVRVRLSLAVAQVNSSSPSRIKSGPTRPWIVL